MVVAAAIATASFAQGLNNVSPANRLPGPQQLDPGFEPPVHLAGAFELRDGDSIRFEDGEVIATGGDIQLQVVAGGDIELQPTNGARWSYRGDQTPGYRICADLSTLDFDQARWRMSDISEGDFFCVRTADGKEIRLRIVQIRPLLRRVSGSFIAWEWQPRPISN